MTLHDLGFFFVGFLFDCSLIINQYQWLWV